MQPVLLHVLPVLGGDDVAQGIGEVVLHQLGHAGGAAGEIHQHHVVPAGGLVVRRAGKHVRMAVHAGVQVQPALAGAAHDNPVLQRGNLGEGGVHLRNHEVVVHADHGLDAGGVAAVHDVLLRQLQRGGNQYHAQLVQRRGAYPVLPAAAHDHHRHVALAQPKVAQEVGDAVGHAADVGKREHALLVFLVDPHQRPLFRLGLGPGVHDVVAEVEILGHVDGKLIPELLVAFKIDLREKFVQQVIQSNHAPLCYSAMTVKNRAFTLPPQRWPWGMVGLK